MSHILKSQLFSLSVNVAPGTQIGQVLDRLSVGRAAVTAFFAFVILLATSPLFAAEPVAKSEPDGVAIGCLLYTSPSPRDKRQSRMPSSA